MDNSMRARHPFIQWPHRHGHHGFPGHGGHDEHFGPHHRRHHGFFPPPFGPHGKSHRGRRYFWNDDEDYSSSDDEKPFDSSSSDSSSDSSSESDSDLECHEKGRSHRHHGRKGRHGRGRRHRHHRRRHCPHHHWPPHHRHHHHWPPHHRHHHHWPPHHHHHGGHAPWKQDTSSSDEIQLYEGSDFGSDYQVINDIQKLNLKNDKITKKFKLLLPIYDFDSKNIKIRHNNGELIVEGKQMIDTGYGSSESRLHHSIKLPENVDPKQLKIKCNNGYLKIFERKINQNSSEKLPINE